MAANRKPTQVSLDSTMRALERERQRLASLVKRYIRETPKPQDERGLWMAVGAQHALSKVLGEKLDLVGLCSEDLRTRAA